MFLRKLLNKKMFKLFVGLGVLLIPYSLIYLYELIQVSTHEDVLDKMLGIGKYYSAPSSEDSSDLLLYTPNNILLAETYNIDFVSIERSCGKRCSKYFDSEGDPDEWEQCSQECDVRDFKKSVIKEANRHINQVNNWWNIFDDIRAYKKETYNRIEQYYVDYQQAVIEKENFDKLELLAEQSISEEKKQLDEIMSKVSASNLSIDKDRIMYRCNDEVENEFENIESYQAIKFRIRCKGVFYTVAIIETQRQAELQERYR